MEIRIPNFGGCPLIGCSVRTGFAIVSLHFVPEPSTVALTSGGLAVLLLGAWRQGRRRWDRPA